MAKKQFRPVIKIQMAEVLHAMQTAPNQFAYQFGDGLLHIKRKFFKSWLSNLDLNLARPFRKSLYGKFRGYVNVGNRGVGVGKQSDERKGLVERLALTQANALDMSLNILSRSNVAEYQEFGGTIYPQEARYLRVPIPGPIVQTMRGKTRKKFKKPYAEWSDLDKRKSFIRDGVVFYKPRIRGTEIVPIFVLRKKVTLRNPGLNFYKTWRALGQFPNQRIQQAAQKAIRIWNQGLRKRA
jgi:hypothetical protein|tara:strand:+ start:6862 stop:7578 length:717 start_codon:yes stop_codon:yes gene_type:complete